MPKRPPLAKSELELARIVWRLGEATVRQVLEALPPERGLDFATVQTYLRRLEAKGYLRVRQRGRANIYSSRVEPDRVVGEVVRDFLDRVFDGQPLPLVEQLINDRGLSDEEIERLQRTLDELKERKR
ncbi:MAG: transcriptional regulator [Planctomycetia bacterium 21-64-5]|nr:MAG: transcriptional regulator [Planctomycetia bacterium 21-64-5]HQU42954.1 BlaI/MecI/CopY family transcriptional regulator [Pirellulales bacterium]